MTDALRTAAALLILAATPAPAMACGTVVEGGYFKGAHEVVEGEMRCDSEADQCQLFAADILKSERPESPSRPYTIKAGYREMERVAAGDTIIWCTVPFAPGASQVEGRFYLMRRDDGRYDVWTWQEPDENGEYPDLA